MSAATTFAEAIAAVPHDATCETVLPRENSPAPNGSAIYSYGPCDCDRDARIAKGVEGVVIACVPEPWPSAEQTAAALAAFVGASR